MVSGKKSPRMRSISKQNNNRENDIQTFKDRLNHFNWQKLVFFLLTHFIDADKSQYHNY